MHIQQEMIMNNKEMKSDNSVVITGTQHCTQIYWGISCCCLIFFFFCYQDEKSVQKHQQQNK